MKRLGPRYARTRSGSPKPRRGRSKSPRKKGPERRTVFKRFEKGVFQWLGDKEKNVSAHSRGSKRKSYYSGRRDTESCYQSSRSKETETASEKHRHKREYSRRTKAVLESEGSAGGHWKSKPNKQKLSMEDELSQPWESSPGKLPPTEKMHQRSGRNPQHQAKKQGIHERVFEEVNRRNAKGWKALTFDQGIKAKPQKRSGKDSKKRGNLRERQTAGNINGATMAKDSKAKDYSNFLLGISNFFPNSRGIRRDGSKFCPEIKNQLILTNTPLVGFSREIIWPLGQISLLVKIGDEEHSTTAWMNFMVVRSPSPYNRIIGRTGNQEYHGLPLTKSKKKNSGGDSSEISGTNSSNRIYPNRGRKELCGLLRRHLDVFAWKPADMTGVLRNIAEHRLNVCKGCLPIRQKKRGQAPERNKAISEEVKKLVEADIMKEVHYHSWLSNPVMVKKHDDSWRMCVDFKDLNKACPKNGYPLPKINWKTKKRWSNLPAFSRQRFPKTYWSKPGGYKVDVDGLRLSLDKVKAVIDLPSPKCLKDVQKLNEKLASLNRFMSKSAKKSLPFFKTLKKCTKERDFQWTPEEKGAFKEMKQSIAKLSMLTTPKEKKELIMYLAAAKEAINADVSKGQILADFIVERLDDDAPDTPMKDREELPDPWILFTDGSSCIDGSGAGLIITNPEEMEFTYALRFRLNATNNEAEYKALIPGLWITWQIGVQNLQANVDSKLVANQVNGIYIAKESSMIRGENKKADALSKIASTSFVHLSKQVLVEELREKAIDKKEILAVVKEEGHTWMTPVYEYLTEGILPEEKKKARTVRRKAGRYVVINEVLYKKSFLGLWLWCVGPLQENYVLREIHEGSCSMHAGPRFVVAKALRSGYFWPTMHTDARNLIKECKYYQVHRPVPRNPQEKLTPITSLWPFYKWGIDIAGPFSEGPGKVKFLIVAMDYFPKWIEARPVATITGTRVKFVWDNIVCRFGLPGEIISDNEKQFRDNPFKDWCEKLSIRQCFASVKHPQANGLVERANRSLGEGIKARLREKNKNWVEEVLHVLWAHRTMIKSSNGETPFSLTYGAEAVIPAKIGMPTLRTTEVDTVKNNEALGISLDLLEEKREQDAIQEAMNKAKMEGYYNARVRSTNFRPGDFVYRSNEASQAKDGGKLEPKWEGPYEVTKALGK
uniref:Reverse transcriptase domain-containing protein n=1 Tax=Tanacetum cinerariifolium TaxID=118510 RepID=A0A6L2N8G4_TANCI|nr:reverse transcriptase domain-containing protein [Tanacetum cinerariifolium]